MCCCCCAPTYGINFAAAHHASLLFAETTGDATGAPVSPRTRASCEHASSPGMNEDERNKKRWVEGVITSAAAVVRSGYSYSNSLATLKRQPTYASLQDRKCSSQWDERLPRIASVSTNPRISKPQPLERFFISSSTVRPRGESLWTRQYRSVL